MCRRCLSYDPPSTTFSRARRRTRLIPGQPLSARGLLDRVPLGRSLSDRGLSGQFTPGRSVPRLAARRHANGHLTHQPLERCPSLRQDARESLGRHSGGILLVPHQHREPPALRAVVDVAVLPTAMNLARGSPGGVPAGLRTMRYRFRTGWSRTAATGQTRRRSFEPFEHGGHNGRAKGELDAPVLLPPSFAHLLPHRGRLGYHPQYHAPT